ncbi:hypothetical protein [Mycoplana ramosa]|uniref:Uncharacterized protein n=1 Tax=Mycoplana ramosa TaxID=40837 RepID=A0ABW3YXU0_MYCRA
MNDNITMTAASLATFLDRIGLPPVARTRIVEIDRILADEIASGDPDADGCAALAVEAADLISYANPPVFDWKGWDDDDDPGDVDGLDSDAMEWGEE